MEVKKIIFVDVYRDGGSYGLGYEGLDGKEYEFHIQSNRLRKKGFKQQVYEPPVIYLGRRNDRHIVKTLNWKEAQAFLARLQYQGSRFAELHALVNQKGNMK
jgi:hypothetical protein